MYHVYPYGVFVVYLTSSADTSKHRLPVTVFGQNFQVSSAKSSTISRLAKELGREEGMTLIHQQYQHCGIPRAIDFSPLEKVVQQNFSLGVFCTAASDRNRR